MSNLRQKMFFILLLVLVFAIIDMPESIPIRFKLGNIKIEKNIVRPKIELGKFKRDLSLRMGLDIQGGSRLVYSADVSNLEESKRNLVLESTRKIVEQRVNYFGITESSVRTSVTKDEFRILVELPGIKRADEAISLIGRTAQLEFREFKNASESSGIVPSLQNTTSTGVTGRDMEAFAVSFNSLDGSPSISFETTAEGKEKFASLTKRLVGKPLVAFLDDQVISIATVQSEIVGNGQITGKFTLKEARNLANLFNAGALPISLRIIEQKNIGAALGKESIGRSMRAGLIGLGVVVLFMILYYGRWGLVASSALLIYGLTTLAVYKLLPVTLTLPGIAGFILSVGMAVDSNILIFERMKEELRSGKPLGIAMELGFGRAWNSIKDANVATLIATFVLFNPFNWQFLNSSGLVRGFALTLFLGILISLFSGIFVTRTLLRSFLKG